jgi:predicted ATPase
MSEMIRKQFYIHERHQLLLRKLARAKGVSEAEIIRQAIEHEAAGARQQIPASDRVAWQEIVRAVEARKHLGSGTVPYHWDRQDAYQDRDERFPPTAW